MSNSEPIIQQIQNKVENLGIPPLDYKSTQLNQSQFSYLNQSQSNHLTQLNTNTPILKSLDVSNTPFVIPTTSNYNNSISNSNNANLTVLPTNYQTTVLNETANQNQTENSI